MRKYILAALSVVLCLNFSICASAEDAVMTAVETAVPATETSVAEDFSYVEEGGLVPTYIDETIEPPEFTLSDEEYTGALPEHEEKGEYISVFEKTNNFGADGIVPATREEGTPIAKYMTMGDLYQAWYDMYEYRYPDYVCGVWTETGDMSELVVAVTKDEAGEKGKEEILSLIENDDSVKFTYQSYSYKELRQVQEEISPLMGDSSGIFGLGVSEMENKVHADIDMSNPNAESVVEKLLAQYGDKVVFQAGGGITLDAETEGYVNSAGGDMDGAFYSPSIGEIEIVPETGGYDAGGGYQEAPAVTMEEMAVITIGATDTEQQDNTWVFAVCGAAVLVLGAVIAFAVSRARVRQTTAGTVTDGSGNLTRKDTERIVSESEEVPAKDIMNEIMKEIEK